MRDAEAGTGDGERTNGSARSRLRMIPTVRLARHTLRLCDGHQVQALVAGHGMPLVVVHGFAAQGLLYAQTLSRLVGMGFRVIAIDSPGHGGTEGVGVLAHLDEYAAMVLETLDHLGVRQAVLVGHSMGGRLVTELAASAPERVLGVILIDAIVGDVWDRMVEVFRLNPALVAGLGVGMVADTVASLPVRDDPLQALKLLRLVFPTTANHVRRPWRLVGPMLSIMRARRSVLTLDRLRVLGIPTWLVHGDRDLLVPLCTARAAAQRCGGTVVRVHRARHSWMLSDPETFPAIMRELVNGALGDTVARACTEAGGAGEWDPDDLERCFVEQDSLVARLEPADAAIGEHGRHRTPRFRWSIV